MVTRRNLSTGGDHKRETQRGGARLTKTEGNEMIEKSDAAAKNANEKMLGS